MRAFPLLVAFLYAFQATAATKIVAVAETPILGPSFLSNFDSSNSSAIDKAKTDLSHQIGCLFSNGVLNNTDLTFHIDVFSAATNGSIYTYSHVANKTASVLTAGKFDDQTISRIGSITKLFTAYAIIAKGGMEVFGHPVVKYLPELAGNSSANPLKRINWHDINVGALLSHQAGTGGPRDFLVYYYNPNTTEAASVKAFLKYMRDVKRPVISPYHTAIYSDAGYAVLGQVLARMANTTTYTEAIQEIIFKPLGLKHTSTKVPKARDGLNAMDRKTVQPTSSWGLDIELFASTGSIYSTASDLRRVGLSILNSELLSPAHISAWMKPRSGTGSLVELVGAPWEIERLEVPASPGSNRTRVSDLYTKVGGNGDYNAIFALSPDHGIGFSILLGGETSEPARWTLRDAVGQVMIPAAESAAWRNAKKNLAGTFVLKSAPFTNMTLTVDEDKSGLGLKSFWIKGQDAKLKGRLYPSGLNSVSRSLASLYRSTGQVCFAHRIGEPHQPLRPRAAVEGGAGGLFDDSLTWQDIDFAGDSTDEFDICLTDGKVNKIVWPFNGLEMERLE
ncbi:Beta-lactamase domain-containing protein [Penicillium ucsense]|uniref:Beta-lactamase domain-containing protein n=1 Tax=Penicillium ucsense TaxID=2839758 RepID=A0A8J8W5L0_9EURO|nr:Beta-lactamase domain-containing protein [Penicillium ucsense]KAF7735775.1 Beta-lactamase domain-containing protein [Penicillium ucsense]